MSSCNLRSNSCLSSITVSALLLGVLCFLVLNLVQAIDQVAVALHETAAQDDHDSKAGDVVSMAVDADGRPPTPTEPFIATHEWQEIKPGHVVPSGLHYRMNFETGKKEAKLLDDDQHKNEDNQITEGYKKASRTKNVKFQKSVEIVKDDNDRKQEYLKLKTIEKIKREFSDSGVAMKSETELLVKIIDEYKFEQAEKESSETIKERIRLLADIEYYLHKIDVANDFVKLNGIQLILPDLNSTNDGLRASVAIALGTAMQNNEKVQEIALSLNILPTLLRVLSNDNSSVVKQRCLYAISCLIRNYSKAQAMFVGNGGVNTLLSLFGKRSTSTKLQIKAVALVTDILAEETVEANSDKSGFSEALESHDFCEYVIRLLNSKDQDAVYAALDAASQVLKTNLKCKDILSERINSLRHEALALLDNLEENRDKLHSWVQQLISSESQEISHNEL